MPRSEFSRRDWYDVWYPNLAPSPEIMKLAHAAKTERDWASFFSAYRREMATPDASRSLDLLAALSHGASYSVGCYCEDESHCHRSALKALLVERGAAVA